MLGTRKKRKRHLGRSTVAKPIRPTPPVTGAVAREIQKELRDGTPNTPQRVETINRAIEVFRRSTEPPPTPTGHIKP